MSNGMWTVIEDNDPFLSHHGVLGMKWGVRRYQNKDGSLTPLGRKKYYKNDGSLSRKGKRQIRKTNKDEYKAVKADIRKFRSTQYKKADQKMDSYDRRIAAYEEKYGLDEKDRLQDRYIESTNGSSSSFPSSSNVKTVDQQKRELRRLALQDSNSRDFVNAVLEYNELYEKAEEMRELYYDEAQALIRKYKNNKMDAFYKKHDFNRKN